MPIVPTRSERSSVSGQRGQDAVEFALLLPLLMLILLGILDLGRLYFAAITINNAAREGARYGIEHAADPGLLANIRARAHAEVAGTGIILVDDDIQLVCPAGGCVSLQPLRVEVTYHLNLIVPGIFGWSEVPVRSFSEMLVM